MEQTFVFVDLAGFSVSLKKVREPVEHHWFCSHECLEAFVKGHSGATR